MWRTYRQNEVKVLSNISPEQMKMAQIEDANLSTVVQNIKMHKKALSYAKIRKFKSLIIRKYLLQFDQLGLIKGILH